LLEARNLTKTAAYWRSMSLICRARTKPWADRPEWFGKPRFSTLLPEFTAPTPDRRVSTALTLPRSAVYQVGYPVHSSALAFVVAAVDLDNIMIGNTNDESGLWFNSPDVVISSASSRKAMRPHARLSKFLTCARRSPVRAGCGLPMIDRCRIEICRALIGELKLLPLDEPSAGAHEETANWMDDICWYVRTTKTCRSSLSSTRWA
jgi:hypothetical protein